MQRTLGPVTTRHCCEVYTPTTTAHVVDVARNKATQNDGAQMSQAIKRANTALKYSAGPVPDAATMSVSTPVVATVTLPESSSGNGVVLIAVGGNIAAFCLMACVALIVYAYCCNQGAGVPDNAHKPAPPGPSTKNGPSVALEEKSVIYAHVLQPWPWTWHWPCFGS